MGFQDVVFLPSRASFFTTFLNICWRPPHVLKLWLGVSNGMLPEDIYAPTNPLFMSVECHRDHETKLR